jgi:hypothetical protein
MEQVVERVGKWVLDRYDREILSETIGQKVMKERMDISYFPGRALSSHLAQTAADFRIERFLHCRRQVKHNHLTSAVLM